jgi:integrase/recombinase XerD
MPGGRREEAREIVAVMRAAGQSPEDLRVRALIIVLWRAGLRVSEALALQGIDNGEIINTVFARPAPTLPASAGLR